jgi:anti-anti-sigma factor
MAQSMEWVSEKVGRMVTIRVTGRMDAVTAPGFEQECSRWIDQGENDLAVDLSELEYISSAGLRAILGTGKKLKSRGGSLAFGGMSPMVREVFEISGFSAIFAVYDTLETALAAR